jgi:[NiFe] hydrogenase large subunit
MTAEGLTVEDADPSSGHRVRRACVVRLPHRISTRPRARPTPCSTSTTPTIATRGPRPRATTVQPMEAGPLSRMLVAYLRGVEAGPGDRRRRTRCSRCRRQAEVLVSLLGRVAARNLETKVVCDWSLEWCNELIAGHRRRRLELLPAPQRRRGQGAGLWEAPRGALGHWIDIQGGKIARYQVVTPSTWDISSRDADGVRGPMEEALVGTPIIDVERPLEACRVARSFDP